MLALLMQHLAEATPTQVVSIWGEGNPRYRLGFSLGVLREVKPGFSKPGYGLILVTDQNMHKQTLDKPDHNHLKAINDIRFC